MSELRFHAFSIQGRRGNNEDSTLVLQISPENYLFAVADGMGGAAAGETASKLAVETIADFLKNELIIDNPERDFKGLLLKAYEKAHQEIAALTKKTPELAGMGTTLTCLLIVSDKFWWANLGDSRIYRLTETTLNLLSRDHSYIQEYYEKNGAEVSEELLRKYGNYITKSLDGRGDIPDIYPTDKEFEVMKENDMFLLCSDGLITDKSRKDQAYLAEILLASEDIGEVAENLTSFAFDEGSKDNISVVLVENGKIKRKGSKIFSANKKSSIHHLKIEKRKKRQIICFLSVLLAAIAIVGFIVLGKARTSKSAFSRSYNTLLTTYAKPENTAKDSIVPFPASYKSGWKAFDQADFRLPFSRSSYIFWEPLVIYHSFDYYLISIKSDTIYINLKLEKDKSSLILDGIAERLRPGDYKLIIKGMSNKNEVVGSDSILFKYK